MTGKSIQMTVAAYNAIPAIWRKTENGVRYIFVEAKEWREVEFVKEQK